MNEYRFKFRTPYYLPDPDGKDQFVGFQYWDARHGRPEMMVTWGPDEQCTGLKDINGNLIYAGDVVICHARWLPPVKAKIAWIPMAARFGICRIDESSIPWWNNHHLLGIKIKIVGNIHETKEA